VDYQQLFQTQQQSSKTWTKKASKLPAKVLQEQKLNRFELTILERIHFMSLALVWSFGWGKSTSELINRYDSSIWVTTSDALKILSIVLLLTSIGTSVYSAKLAQEKNYSTTTWFLRGLLGGPLAIAQLQSSS
jgi:hypothetical protein